MRQVFTIGSFAGHQAPERIQPKINLKSGEITGVEALLRWRHPGQGLIPPMEFIPIAES
jgi:EAL domain-containing protein (putative c-di-GMP-specific phosphodiesterase class I)